MSLISSRLLYCRNTAIFQDAYLISVLTARHCDDDQHRRIASRLFVVSRAFLSPLQQTAPPRFVHLPHYILKSVVFKPLLDSVNNIVVLTRQRSLHAFIRHQVASLNIEQFGDRITNLMNHAHPRITVSSKSSHCLMGLIDTDQMIPPRSRVTEAMACPRPMAPMQLAVKETVTPFTSKHQNMAKFFATQKRLSPLLWSRASHLPAPAAWKTSA